jgi:ferredoxin-type protein NapF
MVDMRRRGFLRGDVRAAAAPVRTPGMTAQAVTTGDAAPVASIYRGRCLADRGVECRLCGDACEPRAIRFRPARGGIAALALDAAACTGCGECLATCPVGAIGLVARNG